MTEKTFPHLADVGFERIAPSADLRPFIQWFWYIRSSGSVTRQREEFMHPDGSLGLVFNWGSELAFDDPQRHNTYTQSAVFDTVTARSRKLQLVGSVEAFGILFRAGGAFPVFGIPVGELSAADGWASGAGASRLAQLYALLYGATLLSDKVALAERWLRQLLAQGREPSSVVAHSLALIGRSYGRLSIQQVADSVHLSPRQLERLYQEQVGLSPKKMARIQRVRAARTAVKGLTAVKSLQTSDHPDTSLTDIGHHYGYYDQAHFIHEFKAVIGLTPGAYLARQQERRTDEQDP